MMNERIKKLVVAALTSGEYTQSRHALRTDSGYCCLGVICDLAAKEGIGQWARVGSGWLFKDKDGNTRHDVLTPAVKKWAGIAMDNPDTSTGSLAHRNDRGATFGEIASAIEEEL